MGFFLVRKMAKFVLFPVVVSVTSFVAFENDSENLLGKEPG